ncbi:helix-turn-helix transcriptional regulator [Saccharopolyspora sp. NPDC047091]|uniref:helix-turn-helix domain-containing protein n=1 Tax=Saccharopolyspora sp. NPDC047091 TaxID=3155924 RepID=UPI0033DD4FFF
MAARRTRFATELRRFRQDAGWSLAHLAERVHYSKGYLSKVENGVRRPNPELARSCDAALGAGGALASLVPAQPSAPEPGPVGEGDLWLMDLTGDAGWFRLVDRGEVAALGVPGAEVPFAYGGGSRGRAATALDAPPLEVFRRQFDLLRELGQTASHGAVLPVLAVHSQTLRRLAADAGPSSSGDLLVLSARYAEYAGWMAQESGDDRAALWWTDRAVEFAAAGGDRHLASYALVCRGLITLYRDDARQTIELSRRAQQGPVPPRIGGLAAQREAQGHALAGDYDSCLRALDRSRELLARAAPEHDVPVLGPKYLPDPTAMITGWCLHDLGRSRRAAEVLDGELARVPEQALRTRARYGMRRALAYASAGAVEHACALTGALLAVVDSFASATILSDLRRISRTLSRFHANRCVRELYPRLTAALHTRTS